MAGFTHRSKTIDPEDIGTVSVHSPNHANYYPGSSMIHLDLTFNRRTGQVLGGQAVGNQGVDKRIDVISSYIHMKGTVTDLVQAELCYSPPVGVIPLSHYYEANDLFVIIVISKPSRLVRCC